MPSYSLNDNALRRSLNLNIFAISMGMVFFTVFGNPLGSPLFTGFLRSLGAGDLIYSVVMALPVLGAVSQIFGAYFLETTGRRKLIYLASGFVHRILWIPVALIPLFAGGGGRQAVILSITILITLSSVGNSINSMAFNSWMGSLIPADIAGRFFGLRTLVSTISGAASGIAVGIFIDHVNNLNGFAIVFIIGALFGICDIATFFGIRHPKLLPPKERTPFWRLVAEPFKNRNYLILTLFATAFNFGLNVAGPFFNVYMIENLKMNYFLITISNQIMSSITTVLIVRKWGTLADRYGNKPVLFLSGLGVVLAPFTWLFAAPGAIPVVFVANLISGLTWSGFNLALFNQSVWLAPERNRSSYVACFTVLTSVIGTALAYVCGGFFMQYAGPYINGLHIPFILHSTLSSYQVLFVISSLLRLLAVLFLLPIIYEANAQPVRVMLGDFIKGLKARFQI